MVSYNKIAVGTDGSDTSLKAVRVAASLARAYEAELLIISAHYSNTGALLNSPNRDVSTLPVVSEGRAQEYLEEASRIADDEGAKKVELMHREGAPSRQLISVVEEAGVDLLVIGNKGVNSLPGRLFGNIPTDVARQTPVDLMMVNTQETRA